MDKMKVWCFKRYGPPSALELQERDRPVPGQGEVLIKVAAAGVNPSDVKNVAGLFRSTLPRVPGRDFAGVVAGGDGREGEAVWGSGPGFGVTQDGTHQQYVVLPSAWVPRKPDGLAMDQAAAIGVPWLAAWTSLVTIGKLQAGEILLITGVSGSVGNAATQIAQRRHARVIGVGRSSENPSGADALIDTTRSDLTAEARALTDGKGVDMVLDAVGGPLFEACLKSLRKGGRQIALASNPRAVTFNLVDFYHNTARLLGMDTMALTGTEVADILGNLAAGFESGAYRAPRVRKWPFDHAVDAYQAVSQPNQRVKHVLVMA